VRGRAHPRPPVAVTVVRTVQGGPPQPSFPHTTDSVPEELGAAMGTSTLSTAEVALGRPAARQPCDAEELLYSICVSLLQWPCDALVHPPPELERVRRRRDHPCSADCTPRLPGSLPSPLPVVGRTNGTGRGGLVALRGGVGWLTHRRAFAMGGAG
jgi:hypothetical protein